MRNIYDADEKSSGNRKAHQEPNSTAFQDYRTQLESLDEQRKRLSRLDGDEDTCWIEEREASVVYAPC